MTAQHTAGPTAPGPWAWCGDKVKAIDHGHWYTVADCRNPKFTPESMRANARRIVDCVNACDEAGWEPGQGSLVTMDSYDALRTERDALRTAAQSALALLLDGDAEPGDADRVGCERRNNV
jgi:hypothetical protein